MREIKYKYLIKGEWHVLTLREIEAAPYSEILNGEYDARVQYTGLKDKNGVEIYEGDILEFEYDDDYTFASKPYKVKRQVKWDTYYGAGWNFGISHKDGLKRWSYPQPPSNAEVIGNIYENPDLLETTK